MALSPDLAGVGALPGLAARKRPAWAGFLSFLRHKPLGSFGLLLVALLVFTAVFADLLANHDPETVAVRDRLLGPGPVYYLGTDHYGRDTWSRIVYGARPSLYVGIFAVVFGTVVGSLVGLVSGYFGRTFDAVAQRIMDMIQAFPLLILAMTIVAALGTSVQNVVIALGIVITPSTNRVVRGTVLSVKENQYVEAARAIGCRHARIILVHILPNVLAPIIILASITLGLAILTEASLSFLGLGPPPPTPTWGSMLSGEGRDYFERQPWLAVWPGVAISLAVLGFNFFGDALRDVLDPRLRGSR